MDIYNYDSKTKEFIFKGEVNIDPKEENKFVMPENSTRIKSLVKKDGFAICFDQENQKWQYRLDHRGLEYIKDLSDTSVIFRIDQIEYPKEKIYLTSNLDKTSKGELYNKYNKNTTPNIENQRSIEIEKLNIKVESHFVDTINNGFRYNNYWITCREIDRLELLEIRQTLELIEKKQNLKLTKSKVSKSIERPYRCYLIEKNIKSKEKEFYKFTILEFDSLYEEGGIFITEQKKKENEIKQKIKTLSLTELENFIL